MKITETPLPGVLIVEPRVYGDDRGFFLETYNETRFRELGLPTHFRQDNHSRSSKGVLRGLHYQLKHPQGKLVGVTRGEVYDVAVDIRRGSPTFGQSFGMTLHEDAHKLLYIPPGFAHGFCVTSDVADFVYKCTETYAPGDEYGVIWNDASLGITWPVKHPILSPKDESYGTLRPDRTDLPEYVA